MNLLNDLFDEIKSFLKRLKENDKVCLVHHDDADGCCSAALFSILVKNIIDDYPILFPVRGDNDVNKRVIDDLKSLNPDFVFVVDAPVNPKKLNIFNGFILDHHLIEFKVDEQSNNMIYFNPRKFEKDEERVPPTSCMVYRVLNDLFPNEKVAWISGIGITEDHRVELCKDIFEKIKQENPELLKIKSITQKNIEKSIFGQLWDMVRSGRMVRTVEGARTATLALLECKDRPDKFVNGLTQHSSALRKFYDKVAYETQDCLDDVDKRGEFHRDKKVIFYEHKRTRLSGMTSYLSDKIRQAFPEWICCVINKHSDRKAKISIRLEQSIRKENLVEVIDKMKKSLPHLTGGGHKSAIGAFLDINYLEEFKDLFLLSI